MIRVGDCLEVMQEMEAESVDSIVTDPPYGLSFMGKDWDHGIPGVPFWAEALRVAKPGAHLLAFGGTRTFHRLTCAIEDAGWEIRDCLMWLYGSGFPKSLNVSKAIDKEAGLLGHESQAFTVAGRTDRNLPNPVVKGYKPPAPATEAAKEWDGWGTGLKPAWEPIIMARKPLVGTVAQNVQRYGTGAINVDGCRIETPNYLGEGTMGGIFGNAKPASKPEAGSIGRWPANLLLDEEAAAMLDEQSGKTTSGKPCGLRNAATGFSTGITPGSHQVIGYGDSGGASRFFYIPKADDTDRNEGCEGITAKSGGEATDRKDGTAGLNSPRAGAGRGGGYRNYHPTVKPTDLMRYLCRLVTPPGGTVLDPFAGSGSTGKAALLEGFKFILIEINPEYAAIAEKRLRGVTPALEGL